MVRGYLDSVRERVLDAAWASPDEVRYAARIWVWVRWFVAAACLFVLVALPVSSTKSMNSPRSWTLVSRRKT